MEQITRNLLPHLVTQEPAGTILPGDFLRVYVGADTEPSFMEVEAVHVEPATTLIYWTEGRQLRSVTRHTTEAVAIVRAGTVAAQDAITARRRSQHLSDRRRVSGGPHGLTRAQEDATYGEPPRGWEP